MPSIDDVLEEAEPHHKSVRLCLLGNLSRDHEHLNGELVVAIGKHGDKHADVVQLAEQVRALEIDMRERATEFVYKALGRPAWKKLLADHPPTEEQLKDDPTLKFDPDEFPIAAMVASMIEPSGVTRSSLLRLIEKMTDTQYLILWDACLAANGGVTGLGESKAASSVLRSSPPSSELPSDLVSAEASSSAEQ